MRCAHYRSIKISVTALAVATAAAVMGSPAHAALINQTANDGIGTSSFNAAGTWSNAAAPSAGNTYTNVDGTGLGHLLRTPGSAGNFTFAGDSLTIGSNNATDLNQSLIFKGTGGSAASCPTSSPSTTSFSTAATSARATVMPTSLHSPATSTSPAKAATSTSRGPRLSPPP